MLMFPSIIVDHKTRNRSTNILFLVKYNSLISFLLLCWILFSFQVFVHLINLSHITHLVLLSYASSHLLYFSVFFSDLCTIISDYLVAKSNGLFGSYSLFFSDSLILLPSLSPLKPFFFLSFCPSILVNLFRIIFSNPRSRLSLLLWVCCFLEWACSAIHWSCNFLTLLSPSGVLSTFISSLSSLWTWP